jgi:methylated-DNA-protein-cysteine methyltransferase-like protein
MDRPPDEAAKRAARILATVRAIPRGRVLTYGEVAAQAGLPGRARLVARVLATVNEPGLPWHRVVASGGRIALPVGSESARLQRQRLAAEGLAFCGTRLQMPPSDVQDLDALLWGPGGAGPRRR